MDQNANAPEVPERSEASAPKLPKRTWGHAVLLVLSIIVFIVAGIAIIFCGTHLSGIMAVGADGARTSTAILCGIGLGMGILAIPPSIVGIIVAIRAKSGMAAVGFGVAGIILVAAFVAYALMGLDAKVFSVTLYAIALVILPIIYLVASIKVHFTWVARRKHL